MNMVKRKGTRVARKIPSNYDDVRDAFLSRVTKITQEAKYPPPELIQF